MSRKDKKKLENLPVRSSSEFPDALPLIMIKKQVVFPMSLVTLNISERHDIQLVEDAMKAQGQIAITAVRDIDHKGLDLSNAYSVGCVGRIVQVQYSPQGGLDLVIQSIRRAEINGLVRRHPYLVVRVRLLEDIVAPNKVLDAVAITIKMQMATLIRLSPNIPDQAHTIIDNIDDPGYLSDLIASNLGLSVKEKQQLLETLDQEKRLKLLMNLLQREVELVEVSAKIHEDVKSSVDKGQREYFLRQQLQAIQDELGESEEHRPKIQVYREKIEALALPEEVSAEAFRELGRLARMHESSAEYHIITTYLETLLDLPWNVTTVDQLDIVRAAQVLDTDHYGLEKVKKRILEYLSVRKLKPNAQGPILCFIGPPGVGKTSLGQSIANALGRKFTRMSLGGMRDEAEIRGHRKTYVGALPGRIISNLRKAGSNNPVFILDEIDKVGSDFRGDPSSALLEVLDPAQNNTFTDHYLNVPYDLSKVMFIATANMLDTIPWALRDRMEIIEISSYTHEEKLQIAKRYLVPRQLLAHGLKRKQVQLTMAALRKIIADYTREAGVRNLDREIANVCRGCARKIVEEETEGQIKIDAEDVPDYLGGAKNFYDTTERTRTPGVVTGLAWTATGGDILFIETAKMPGKGNLILTGQLGEVMKESASASLSFLRSHAASLDIKSEYFTEYDLHVHVPAGAVSKDGPSAGVTIFTALTSLLTGKCVKEALAMTGEITLRGVVLPVGGIKEKVLAASRAGVKTIILPERSKSQLDGIPEKILKKLNIHLVRHINEVLDISLGIQVEPADDN